jgi:gag-polypeptide of LTR copia-type
MSSNSSIPPKLPTILNATNFSKWEGDLQATALFAGLWGIISEAFNAAQKELKEWKQKRDKAGPLIYLNIDDSQKVHVLGLLLRPAEMYTKLKAVGLQKKPGARFNAFTMLLSISKTENETLTDLMTRVSKAMHVVQSLRPSPYTLADLDNELESMALIKALPQEYNNFASNLLLMDTLTLEKLQAAFRLRRSKGSL